MLPSSTDRPRPPSTKGLPDPETINDLPLTVMAEDAVPMVDDSAPVATYPDWLAEDTLILTYRIGNNYYQGKQADSREAAKLDAIATYGRVLEENYVLGRAFFRVPRVNK